MNTHEPSDVPPGQGVTPGFPVLHVGPVPELSRESLRLRVFGAVDQSLDLDWDGLLALPQGEVRADFHCVTGWSRMGNLWQGVLFRNLAAAVRPWPSASFVMFRDHDFYSTGVELEVARAPDTLLAYGLDGERLDSEHGGPLRAIVPSRYGWKSCKWLTGIEFLEREELGFWEQRGYHRRGDPWREERRV